MREAREEVGSERGKEMLNRALERSERDAREEEERKR